MTRRKSSGVASAKWRRFVFVPAESTAISMRPSSLAARCTNAGREGGCPRAAEARACGKTRAEVNKKLTKELEREPKESILPSFDVSVIGGYFPEFEGKITGAGESGECSVRLPEGLRAGTAQRVNLRGEPQGKLLTVRGRVFKTAVKGFAPASFVIGN